MTKKKKKKTALSISNMRAVETKIRRHIVIITSIITSDQALHHSEWYVKNEWQTV